MIIFRYLTKAIVTSMLATLTVLLLVFVINQFIHYLNEAASGKLTIHAVILVTLIQIPMLLGYLLPISLFLSILLTLGRLYVDHEMLVLSSCGVSKIQVVRIVMMITLLITFIDAGLMLYIEPLMFRYRTEIVKDAVEKATLQKVLPGRFQTLGNDNWVLYAAETQKRANQFHDIFVALRSTIRDPITQASKWDILSSDSVAEKKIEKGDFFVFNNGYRYSGIPGEKDYQVMQFEQYWARLPIPSVTLEGRYAAMPTQKLFDLYSQDRLAVAEFQWRVVIILSTLAFALLAVPLSEVNPRKGKFAKLLPAILLYVAYANVMFMGRSWIQDDKISSWLGLWWVIVLLLFIPANTTNTKPVAVIIFFAIYRFSR